MRYNKGAVSSAKIYCPVAAPRCSYTGGGFLLRFVDICAMLAPGKDYLSALSVTVGGWPSDRGQLLAL